MNYRLLSGCFEGAVIGENTQILDIAFNDLDDDLQWRIRYWAEDQIGKLYMESEDGNYYKDGSRPLSIDEVKEDYEESWESEETSDEIDLMPLSEW